MKTTYTYRVGVPAELIFDFESSESLTDEQVKERVLEVLKQEADSEEGFDVDALEGGRVYHTMPVVDVQVYDESTREEEEAAK